MKTLNNKEYTNEQLLNKCIAVIDSCITLNQWNAAKRYSKLFSKILPIESDYVYMVLNANLAKILYKNKN